MGESVECGTLKCIKIDPDVTLCHLSNNSEVATSKSLNGDPEENENSGRKRKLPPWMTSSTEDNANQNKQEDSGESSSSKRSKSVEHDAHQDESDSGTTLSIKQEPDLLIPDNKEPIKQENNLQMDTNDPVVKVEPFDNDQPTASTNASNNNDNDPLASVKVEVADNASSAERPSCRYGIKCYRANPIHRREEAHPGDSDYRRPDFPKPPEGTPDCPFGSACYRRNPVHFRDFAHPPDTHISSPPPANFDLNYRNNQIRLQQRLRQQNNANNNPQNDPFDSDSELDENEDPFFDDDVGSDYAPSDGEDEGVVTDLEAEE